MGKKEKKMFFLFFFNDLVLILIHVCYVCVCVVYSTSIDETSAGRVRSSVGSVGAHRNSAAQRRRRHRRHSQSHLLWLLSKLCASRQRRHVSNRYASPAVSCFVCLTAVLSPPLVFAQEKPNKVRPFIHPLL